MQKYVILDLEMCNVSKLVSNHKYHLKKEIIQIGAVILDENLKVVKEFVEYVKPKYGNIDQQIYTLTGISRMDLQEAKYIEDVIYEFIQFIPKEAILVSWSLSDLYQIMDELEEKEIYIEVLDTYYDTWEDCQEMFSDKMNTSKIYKLSEALRIASIDMETKEHDALADAKNTAKLFRKIKVEDTIQLSRYYTSMQEERSIYNPFASLLGKYYLQSE